MGRADAGKGRLRGDHERRQNQGLSDTFGEGLDVQEGATSQTTGNTYFDGTQDALDFLLSTRDRPYCPRPARSGRSHCAKQERRARAGLNAPYNPLGRLVDRRRVGLAGHSYGAAGVSYIGQHDRRVDAIVAWDNLCDPHDCQTPWPLPIPALRVPALGISNDYAGGPIVNPPPDGAASERLSAAGIDTGQLVIRGGTHFEYSYLPFETFPATLRGIHLAAWYTRAWFDKYVKGDPTADRRLTTTHWRRDRGDAKVDPAGEGNLFSYMHKSRLDIRLASGKRFVCEDLRAGCPELVAASCGRRAYSFLRVVTSADRSDDTDSRKPRQRPAETSARDCRHGGDDVAPEDPAQAPAASPTGVGTPDVSDAVDGAAEGLLDGVVGDIPTQ